MKKIIITILLAAAGILCSCSTGNNPETNPSPSQKTVESNYFEGQIQIGGLNYYGCSTYESLKTKLKNYLSEVHGVNPLGVEAMLNGMGFYENQDTSESLLNAINSQKYEYLLHIIEPEKGTVQIKFYKKDPKPLYSFQAFESHKK